MKIEAHIKISYNLSNSEIAKFKRRVLDFIEEEMFAPIDDIPDSTICTFLQRELPNIILESYTGGDCSGIIFDEYFKTIQLDYCEETIYDLVEKMAKEVNQ